MNFGKIIIALVFIMIGIVVVSVFWEKTFLLSFLLILLAFLKHIIAPIKKELIWFVIIGILGSVTESLIVWFGNSPWSYTEPHLVNIPFWLLPLWGLAGTIFITFHEGLLNSN